MIEQPGSAITQKSAYRNLTSAIIGRAMDDLREAAFAGKPISKMQRDDAMLFFYSPDFEAYALELGIDENLYRKRAAEYYRAEIAREGFKAEAQSKRVRASWVKRRHATQRDHKRESINGRREHIV
jgi:hypothetical protein